MAKMEKYGNIQIFPTVKFLMSFYAKLCALPQETTSRDQEDYMANHYNYNFIQM